MSMDIQRILDKLNISPITDEIYLQELRGYQLTEHDVEQFKYYKKYGSTTMFYTDEYLLNKDVDELTEMDERNKEMFQPSLIKRTLNKIESINLKLYLLRRKYFG